MIRQPLKTWYHIYQIFHDALCLNSDQRNIPKREYDIHVMSPPFLVFVLDHLHADIKLERKSRDFSLLIPNLIFSRILWINVCVCPSPKQIFIFWLIFYRLFPKIFECKRIAIFVLRHPKDTILRRDLWKINVLEGKTAQLPMLNLNISFLVNFHLSS